MRGKRAKALRSRTTELIVEYVKDRLLTPEQVEGQPVAKVLSAVPEHGYLKAFGTVKNGILSRRWFYKQVKGDPDVTYEALLKRARVA